MMPRALDVVRNRVLACRRGRLRRGLMLFAIGWLAMRAGIAPAADEVDWAVPEPVLKVDFAALGPETPLKFLDDGAAWEVPLGFTLTGREQVTVEAQLPEAGKFELVQTNAAAQVEVKPQPRSGNTARIDIVRTWKLKTLQDLVRDAEAIALRALDKQRQQAQQELNNRGLDKLRDYLREHKKAKTATSGDEGQVRAMYERLRTAELGAEVLREKLEELHKSRPAWVTEDEQRAWAKASGIDLLEVYGRLLTLDVADKYLMERGLKRETESNFAAVIAGKVEGLDALVSGKTLDPQNDAARQAVKSLAPQELVRTRAGLTVPALCRYYLPADPADPNSQWFHGQRVVCAARNLAAVSIAGTLDPSRGDRADWWTLLEFDPDWVRVEFPEIDGVSYQIHPSAERLQRLRVVGTGAGPVQYRLTLHARTPPREGKAVTVHETSVAGPAKFPF